MKKYWWIYLPLPAIAYLLYRVNWSSESAWLIFLGVVIGANLTMLIFGRR